MESVDHTTTLRMAYDRFNAKDIDGVLALLDPDVEWPDVLNATVLHGTEAVRRYWQSQFDAFSPRVVPHEFVEDGDSVVVAVEQQVSDLAGNPLGPPVRISHRFTFSGAVITRMEVLSRM